MALAIWLWAVVSSELVEKYQRLLMLQSYVGYKEHVLDLKV